MDIRKKSPRQAIKVELRTLAGGDSAAASIVRNARGFKVDGYGPLREAPTDPNDLPETATIIALDPGGTTGWSMMNFHPDALVPEARVGFLENLEEWKHGEIDCGSKTGNLGVTLDPGISTDGEFAGTNEIAGFLRAWPGAAVVIESFDLRQFSKDQDLLSPQRLKATIGYDLWMQSREYFTQRPADKPIASDDRLKIWGLYQREGGMGHARDADRHAIIFARRCASVGRRGRELRERAWPHLYGEGRPYHVSEY